MNKKIKFALSAIIIIVLLGLNVSYAISNTNSQNSFLTVNKEQIQVNETLEVKFNLSKINYNNFKIALNSNVNNDEFYSKNNIKLKEESNALVIEIDKEKMNLSQITICYVIPENTQANSQIQFAVKVIAQEEKEIKDSDGNITKTKQEKTVLEETKNVVVLDNKSNNSKDSNAGDNDKSKTDANKNEDKDSKLGQDTNKEQSGKFDKDADKEKNGSKENTDNKKADGKDSEKSKSANGKNMDMSKMPSQKSMAGSSSKISVNMSGSYSQSTQKVETAVYNGSNNNYLKTLQINGADLNTGFSKENTSYFVTVNNVSNIEVNAEAEESTAKVSIIGNDNLKEGTNKILISVTAQNGETRYYRIFVTCTFNQ